MSKNFKIILMFLVAFSLICTVHLACCAETSNNSSSNPSSDSSNVSSAPNDVVKYYVNISINDKNSIGSSQNINPGDKLTLKVVDSNGKDVVGSQVIFVEKGKPTVTTSAVSQEILSLKGLLSNKYCEKTYDDSEKRNRTIQVFGLFNRDRTANEITLNLVTNFSKVRFTNNLTLTVKKDNKYKDSLGTEFREYIGSASKLEKIIPNFKTAQNIDNSTKNETFLQLVDSLADSSEQILSLLNKDEVKAEADPEEIEKIKATIENENELLASDLQYIEQNIALKEVTNKEEEYKDRNLEYEQMKAELKSEILPFDYLSLCFLLGAVGGFLNVRRWKQKMDYLSTYSKSAEAFSPVKLALIISVVLILLMLVVLAVDNSLAVFNHLI